MDKIIVHVYVPQSVAVREGKTVYGSVEIVPTEEQWRELAREQREWLATRGALKPSTVSNGLIELASTETDWAHVFARIVELFVADEAKRAQEAADRESRILQLLARTDEEWITTGLEVSPVAVFTPRFTRPYGVDDPRIDAVEERLRPEIMRRRDDVIAAARAAREKIEREDAEREAAIAAKVSEAEREITAWAIENGGLELSRAAREGYEIAGAVMDDVAARVAGIRERPLALLSVKTADIRMLVEGSPEYAAAGWEERKAPRALAFGVLDAVKEHVERIERPRSLWIEVLRIMRFEPDTDEEHGEKYTAVIVEITCCVAPDRVVIFRAE